MPARPSPPPVKKESASPPRPPKRGGRSLPVDDTDDDAAVTGPHATAAGDDDDATRGEWLFKQNDMVLGPVTAIVLVERIKQGELSADTPIARDGQPFKPMKLVPLFREAHEGMLEQKRREEEERAYNAAVRRSRVLRVFLFAFVILVPAAAGAASGRIVMTLQPWDDTKDWIAKAPPLVDLPPRPIAPVKSLARADKDDERDDRAGGPDGPADPDEAGQDDAGDKDKGSDRRLARRDRGKKGDKADKSDKADKGDKGDKADTASEGDKGDQGFVKELTNEQAVAPLKSVKGALGACFKAELEANSDMPSQLILAYTITEAGRSANVELTNRELRGRPVQDCVKKALSAARWPRFEGERKNVTVPFNIKKPAKPAGGPVTGGRK